MTTLSQMQTNILRDVRDPDNQTFSINDVNDWIAAGISELSLFSPLLFQEDVTPDINTNRYHLGNGTADRRTNVKRVEVWNIANSPPFYYCTVLPASSADEVSSESGWAMWDGWLWLPYSYYTWLDPTSYLVKVWGYAPHVTPANPADVFDLMDYEETALREYCQMLAIERLLNNRATFAQWQTTPSNTDVTEATLMGMYNALRALWQTRQKQLRVLTITP